VDGFGCVWGSTLEQAWLLDRDAYAVRKPALRETGNRLGRAGFPGDNGKLNADRGGAPLLPGSRYRIRVCMGILRSRGDGASNKLRSNEKAPKAVQIKKTDCAIPAVQRRMPVNPKRAAISATSTQLPARFSMQKGCAIEVGVEIR